MESLPAGVWEDVAMSRNTVEFRTKAMKSLPACRSLGKALECQGIQWNSNGIPIQIDGIAARRGHLAQFRSHWARSVAKAMVTVHNTDGN